MAIPDTGYAEFNDSHSVFRGIMAGVDGTFSGVFDAVNVNAVQNINIRDGAVSAYYGFSFQRGAISCTFTVPKQPFAQVADIIVPVELLGMGDESSPGYISVYRNGALLVRDAVTAPTLMTYKKGRDHGSGRWIIKKCAYAQPIRFIDFGISPNVDSTYTITVENGPQTASRVPNGTNITLLGTAVVGFRKR